jgi:diguanylate cyclase (GGDEF)-like protein
VDGVDPVLLVLAVVATIVTLGWLVVFSRQELRARRRPQSAVDRLSRESRPRDPREAISLVGNALAATHDPRGLLPVILDVTVDATGASGGRVLEGDRVLARVGTANGEQPIELALGQSDEGSEIRLFLDPPSGGLSPEAGALAEWLARQASIALENARLHHVVRKQAITDELTGLVNRRRFNEALDDEIERSQRLGTTLSVLLADLDDFKRINDRFGHPAGDQALRDFANLLRVHLRDIDVAGRLGGEEFGVILPETDLDGALTVAERLRRHVESRSRAGDADVGLTTSVGVAQFRSGSREDLLRRADEGLYRAKQRGKNCVAAGSTG